MKVTGSLARESQRGREGEKKGFKLEEDKPPRWEGGPVAVSVK